ncbi:MAG TPA: 50S ribosomal protein L6 [bacterium]|mgnify:CR=1 FL=1|nr:50S ribosomal protein L6 [bacterium]
MSRVGRLPVDIPEGISVEKQGDVLVVSGQKGQLKQKIHPDVNLKIEPGRVIVEPAGDSGRQRSLHGLMRGLVNNMVVGLTEGYIRSLEIVGVGYRAEKKGNALVLQLGFSHPIYFVPPEGITIDLPAATQIEVKGIDKHLVGQVAAKIRSFRPPEPYKGKGIRYAGEHVRRKAGKATA